MNDEPTNKELMHYIKDIKGDVSEIKVQTKLTNGRVSGLENWRWFITGGLTIITLLILPVVFIIVSSVIKR